ncbi:WD40-repeat-containing domain protein [Flagelloscypha sp. PMI_526]|nr:WD40-repeat-containing domain protein [Flagelloscypha sp. PMI_526]
MASLDAQANLSSNSEDNPLVDAPTALDTGATILQDAAAITQDVGEILQNIPYVKAAAGIVVTILKMRDDVSSNKDRCREIIDVVKEQHDRLQQAMTHLAMYNHLAIDSLEQDFQEYSRILDNIVKALKHFCEKGFIASAERLVHREKIAGDLERLERAIRDFHQGFTFTRLVSLHKEALNNRIHWLLRRLEPAGLDIVATSVPLPTGCLPNTRRDVIDKIKTWVLSQNGHQISLLHAHPGAGKTAISRTLANELADEQDGTLGAVLFCRRQHHSASLLWRHVAAHIMCGNPSIAQAYAEAYPNTESLDFDNISVEVLFDSILTKPIEQGHDPNKPLVVIIDALDEFGGPEDGRRCWRELIDTLALWRRLPPSCRLFLTSRTEDSLGDKLELHPDSVFVIPVGKEASSQSNADIRAFFESEFELISKSYSSLPTPWPSPADVDLLVEAAQGLFIWARTVIENARLKPEWLESNVLKPLRENAETVTIVNLYETTLSSISTEDADEFKLFTGAVITAKVPFTRNGLAQFSQLSEIALERLCKALSSVLRLEPVLSFHHQSFVDFLTSSSCPAEFRCDIAIRHEVMFGQCLKIMNSDDLHFNMGKLESSFLMNKDVPDLWKRVPEHVRYACRWVRTHFSTNSEPSQSSIASLRTFLSTKLLFWLEVLCILDALDSGLDTVSALEHWTTKHEPSLAPASQDVVAFIHVFGQVMLQSYPQIYLSGLPFAPKDSLIAANFKALYPNTVRVRAGAVSGWPQSQTIMHGHTGWILSVAFSPDGTRIVSGSYDRTLRLWDASTGVPIGEPLRGHSDLVREVTFSPDGSRIASCSSDKTIRLWDAINGLPVAEPFRRHSASVECVAFSPDGTRLASGYGDGTIRVWDVATGSLVGEPLHHHQHSVYSVAFSPDGTRIASASGDKTILLWDAHSGTLIGEPLRGHSSSVRSVAFSPDGKRLVSGSVDKTLRLWDTNIGTSIGAPLRGHSGQIESVAFSPDGIHVVSASGVTVRVWDASTGSLLGAPLVGHSGSVQSVAFSPDGTRVVSGSNDKTLRVWDRNSNNSAAPDVAESLRINSSWVQSVAFSPDGTRVVSGSGDNTLCIWDPRTRLPIGELLRGHSGSVRSVAFSPDGSQILSSSSDKTLRLWDASTGMPIGEPLHGHTHSIQSAVFSNNGARIVSGSNDNTLRLWDAQTGLPLGEPLLGHTDWVFSVAFSPDDSLIVSGSGDSTLRLWDANTGTPVGEPLVGHSDWVRSAAFSPDGTCIVSGSGDETVRLWSVETGALVGEILHGHSDSVGSVAFSPDGTRIVSSSDDHTIRLWDVATAVPLGEPFVGHLNSIRSVAFSADGALIASGSDDKTLRLWDGHVAPINPGFPFVKQLAFFTAPESPADLVLFLLESGWVVDPQQNYLFWLPADARSRIQPYGCTALLGSPLPMMELDFEQFKYGSSWTECFSDP